MKKKPRKRIFLNKIMYLKEKLKTKLNIYLHYLYYLGLSCSLDPFAFLTSLRLFCFFPFILFYNSQLNQMISSYRLIVVFWCLWDVYFKSFAISQFLWIAYCWCIFVSHYRLLYLSHYETIAVRWWLKVDCYQLLALC